MAALRLTGQQARVTHKDLLMTLHKQSIGTMAALALALTAGTAAQAQGTSSNTGSNTSSGNSTGAAPATNTATTAGSGMFFGDAFGGDGTSLLPYTRSGYIGLNLGRPDWRTGCTAGFSCDDSNLAFYLYTGGLINEVVGLELGYVNTGAAERNGGSTRSQGLNLSLVARAPIGAFNVFAKAGVLYGQTRVSADLLSGVATGTERGWGGAYALGAGYDFTPQMGVVLEMSRNQFRMPGGGRQDIDSLSLGLVRRF